MIVESVGKHRSDCYLFNAKNVFTIISLKFIFLTEGSNNFEVEICERGI